MEERIYSMTRNKTTLYTDDYVNDDDYSDTTSISTTNSNTIHKRRQPKLKLIKPQKPPITPINITLSPTTTNNKTINKITSANKKKMQANNNKISKK